MNIKLFRKHMFSLMMGAGIVTLASGISSHGIASSISQLQQEKSRIELDIRSDEKALDGMKQQLNAARKNKDQGKIKAVQEHIRDKNSELIRRKEELKGVNNQISKSSEKKSFLGGLKSKLQSFGGKISGHLTSIKEKISSKLPFKKKNNNTLAVEQEEQIPSRSVNSRKDSAFSPNGNGKDNKRSSSVKADTPVAPSRRESVKVDTAVAPQRKESVKIDTPVAPQRKESMKADAPVAPSRKGSLKNKDIYPATETGKTDTEKPQIASGEAPAGNIPPPPSMDKVVSVPQKAKGEKAVTPNSTGKKNESQGSEVNIKDALKQKFANTRKFEDEDEDQDRGNTPGRLRGPSVKSKERTGSVKASAGNSTLTSTPGVIPTPPASTVPVAPSVKAQKSGTKNNEGKSNPVPMSGASLQDALNNRKTLNKVETSEKKAPSESGFKLNAQQQRMLDSGGKEEKNNKEENVNSEDW